ncbi:RNA-directed DNA polymerase, eukaryota, partial [Tanacetum coccineum]
WDMEPSLEGDAIDFAEEEVNSVQSVQEEDALDNLQDFDPFSLSDLIRYTNEGPNDDRYVMVERGGSCRSPFLDTVQQILNQASIVDVLDALIEMGIAMGYNMKGCARDKMDVINNWAGKKQVWESLLRLVSRIEGEIVVMGDFNEVRDASERFGTVFHEHVTCDFNQFIYDSALVDVPLGCFSFTWSNRLGTKMSKLDRFLISKGMFDVFQHLTATVLEKGIPDHFPILLREQHIDYGPPPFLLFHSWMELEVFDMLVKHSWEVPVAGESNAMIIFKKKLQSLKNKIKHWNNIRRKTLEAYKSQLRCEVEDIQTRVVDGSALIYDIQKRVYLIKQIRDINHVENLDLAQKAKIKWAIEGDENSSNFHSSINRKIRQAAIRGVIKDDVWVVEPNEFKAEFKDHFQSRFSKDGGIKKAVWDCGSGKAPGPDGFTFGFFKRFWEVIKEDVFALVRSFQNRMVIPRRCNPSFIVLIPKINDPRFTSEFYPISLIGCQYKIIGKLLANRLAMVIDSIVSPEQSAFIKGRQILDGPMMLSEIITHFNATRRKLMVFKVDFEKTYDSLSWDFLFEVMNKMGFTVNWIAWVKATLTSSRALVLLNGAHTKEFDIQRGLRQGDPLSPFLLFLLWKGFMVQNARRIFWILRVFQLASGLKINLNKSKIIGIGVDLTEVQQIAEMIGCCMGRLPFTYLGVPVGCNMNRIDSWKPIIDKFNKKLSSCKAKFLSIGGRLTLLKSGRFFWGADLGERKLHWISWNMVLSARDSGGLGVGSLAAFNKALLFKWIWRFRDNPNALWARTVSLIHDTYKEGGARPSSRFGGLSPWVNIGQAIEQLEVKGDRPLMEQFSRLFLLDPDPDAKVVERNSLEKLLAAFGREPRSSTPNSQCITLQDSLHAFSFSEAPDRMVWDLAESGVFYVSSMRSCLDSFLLGSSRVPTRWNTLVPRKLNILLWSIFRDIIPTLLNLRDRDIDLDSLLCHVCMQIGESTEHLFSSCPDLCHLWHKIAGWWGVTTPTEMTVKSLVTWADDIALDVGSKHVFDAVIMAAFWTIWSFRNKLLFGTSKPRKDDIFDGLISTDDLMGVIQTLNENATNEEVKEMMNEVDTNEEGTIDFHDFLNIMSKRVKENASDELKEAFKVFDRNQDGYISPDELRNVMINLGERLKDEELEQMIREADLDGDGVISYDEFVRVMMSSS